MEKHKTEMHRKSWGFELWVDNGPDYCGKFLVFEKMKGTTMHFHMNKLETMCVVKGQFLIDYLDPADASEHSLIMRKGDCLRIPRGQPHRITAIADNSIMSEFSTTHEESDSYRVGPRLG